MRTTVRSLNVIDKDFYHEQRRESEIAIRAIEIIEGMHNALISAGGFGDINEVGNISVKEFALMAARNNVKVECRYTGPQAGQI